MVRDVFKPHAELMSYGININPGEDRTLIKLYRVGYYHKVFKTWTYYGTFREEDLPPILADNLRLMFGTRIETELRRPDGSIVEPLQRV